ncbi:ATP-binding protein [Desulfitobacterium sp.]|uniref:ATP-binding protein n=1 Tax=Desulfitobacterium sp. TaxID=49981 RepID=UPI002B1FCADF|nr:ATP-binding protein [Desulfitobacterium sp.]MEA4901909.1 ATP-binding protein [Desulfitobacterium sp.]
METDQYCLDKYRTTAQNQLNTNNSKAVYKLSIILALFTFGLIIIDFLNFKNGLWISKPGYKLLFYHHIVFGVGMICYILGYIFLKNIMSTHRRIQQFYIYSFLLFGINMGALVSGWTNQYIHGQISGYIIWCFLLAAFFYQSPKYSVLIYGQSYIAFLIYITMSQNDIYVLRSHYIYGTSAVILGNFLSIYFSKVFLKIKLYCYNLEDVIQERTTKLEESMQTIQKLERLNLIDKMTATVVHEVRNPLTSIKGFLQLLKDKPNHPDSVEFFNIMINETDRANTIIEKFLSISRDKETVMERGNLEKVVTSILPLLEADVIHRNMKLFIDLRKVPDTLLNEQEIDQVLLNLSRNGIEAMAEGGCLTIKTYQEGDEVILLVADEGSGIPPEVLEKLGTPFFTTKETGTGLGLVVCNSIVERHNAKLQIKSSAEGSSFEVHFKSMF